MRTSVCVAVLVALVAFPAWAGVGSVPLEAAGIEVQGVLSVQGTLRLTILLEPPAPPQPAIHAVRITALPSGKPLLTLVVAGAPPEVTDSAFNAEGAVLKAPATGEALTLQAVAPPPGDNWIRVEYITQLEAKTQAARVVGEVQFASLNEFHFSLEPGFLPNMPVLECGYCGEVRCGCARCPGMAVCCPVCSVACPPYGC